MSGPFSDLPDGTRVWALLDTDGDIDSVYLSWDETRSDLERRGIEVFTDPPADSDLEAEDERGQVVDYVPQSDEADYQLAANSGRTRTRAPKLEVIRPERPRFTPIAKILKGMGLRPLPRSVLDMQVAEAFERLLPYLPPAWDTPEKAVAKLLRASAKSEKTDDKLPVMSLNLSLLPHKLFATWVERGLHGKARGDRDYLRLFYRPGDEEIPSLSVCPFSVDACRRGCLVFTGQNFLSLKEKTLAPLRAKAAATRCLYRDPEAFGALLHHAVGLLAFRAKAAALQPAVRLNNYSDVPWEEFFPDLFDAHPDVQFFDYTKVPGRVTPRNYLLCHSYAGNNIDACEDAIDRGRSVAVVFLIRKQDWAKLPQDQLFPDKLRIGRHEMEVVNGIMHDARWRDEVIPAVVGLRYITGKEIIYSELSGTRLEDIAPGSMGNFLVRAEIQGGYMVLCQTPPLTAESDPVVGEG